MRNVKTLVEQFRQDLGDERDELATAGAGFETALAQLDALAGPGVDAELLAQARSTVQDLRDRLVDARLASLQDRLDALSGIRQAVTQAVNLGILGELSASVAHEIRNPLCGILLSVEVLRTKMDPGDSRATLLNNLHREAEKMEKVVNNLLQFAKQYTPRFVECELADVVMDSIESVKCHLRRKQMEVKVRRSLLNCRAQVDRDLLEQVFGNLLINSVDASPQGSLLEVDLRSMEDPAGVAISFRDPGKGMNPELLGRVFDPFYTSKHNGVGLGLSVSKKIVDAHSGQIQVESRPGEGTTFTVVIPYRTTPHDAEAEKTKLAA